MNRPVRPLLLILTYGLSCGILFSGCKRPEPPAEEDPVAPVKAEHATTAVFGEWTELIGATQPVPGRIARITTPVEGQVLSVLRDEKDQPIAEGQAVEKDQLIARLDDRIAVAQRDKLFATLGELTEARAQADLAHQLATLDLDRLTKLNPVGMPEGLPLISKIEIDKARLAQKDAESKQRGVTAKDKTLQAELRVLKLQLDNHQLRAPIKGVLGPIQVVPGQTLAIGAVIAEVTDLSEIDVVAFAPPRAAKKLRLDDSVWFATKDGAPDRSGPEGRIVFVGDQAQPDTGSILVKARFANKQSRLRANQVTQVLVLTQDAKKRLTIPASCVMEDQDPPLVVVADDVKVKKHPEHGDEDIGTARKLRAYLGLRDRAEHRVEILRLEDPATKKDVPLADVLFIVEGGHGLHDGDVVKVAKQKEH